MADNDKPTTKYTYERRKLPRRDYRAKHRNLARAEGTLSRQDPELAKSTHDENLHLVDWPSFPTTKFAWYHNARRVREQLATIADVPSEGGIEIVIDDDGQIDLRNAVGVGNVG